MCGMLSEALVAVGLIAVLAHVEYTINLTNT